MTTRYLTGNTATLTLAGALTTGITTTWVADIVSIDPGEWTLATRDETILSDTSFMRNAPGDLAEPNEITGVIRFRVTNAAPALGTNVSTVTVTFPKTIATATAATLAGTGYFTRFKFPNMANNETMDAEFTLKMNGSGLAFTKQA